MRTAPVVFAALAACCAKPTTKVVPVVPVVSTAPVEAKPIVPVPDPGPPGLRLSGDVRPTLNHVDLDINPDLDTFVGGVKIEIEIVKPTWVIWLNARDLKILDSQIGGAKARVIPGGEDHVGFTLDRELPAGPSTIWVGYTGTIDRVKSRGIYAEKEGADSYVYTFFEPMDARRAFPCFDEPSFKVPWHLTLKVKTEHTAFANAPVVKETPGRDGWKVVDFAVSKPLPSYLVAFVVGPFEIVDGGTAGRAKTPIRFIIPKGRGGELGYAKEVTPKVVTALEDYFDMAYPYIKLDVAVVPRYWGTMEHPGIVAMGQPLTLIRPDQATRERKHSYTSILAHELAHYWFGDYVTLAWWDDTWLNEALGRWMDLIITDAAEQSWRVLDERVGRAAEAMSADETLSTKSIRQPVQTLEQVQSSFDNAITYDKGSTVLRMFEMYVGATKWRDFIRGYMKAHAWGNATADDLFTAVRAQLGEDAEIGLRSFIEQPGVPRISAEISCTTGVPKLVLKQQRSLPAGVTDAVARSWTVPVCVRYGDAKTSQRVCTLLSSAETTMPLLGCPTWVVLNADAYGYYRTVIDPKVATQLLTSASPAAKSAKLSTAEKLQLVEDVRAAVKRDELTIDKPLALAPVLVKDPDPRVAMSAFTASQVRVDSLDDALYAKFISYYLATYRPLAARLGWKRRASDTDDLHELRQAALGVANHDPALAKEATALVRKWLEDRKGLDDDMVGSALSAATRRGDAALFDQILAAARAPRDRNEKQRLLGALGGFTDPVLAQRALEIVRGNEFDLRDSLSIVWGVFGRRETRQLGLGFVEQSSDQLLVRMRDDEASWYLGGLAEWTCDQASYDRIAAIVTPRSKKIGGAEAAVVRGLEQSRQCIANAKRQLPALTAFLK
jgi:aminopeptidase N